MLFTLIPAAVLCLTGTTNAQPLSTVSPSSTSSSSAPAAPTAASTAGVFSFPLSNGFPDVSIPSSALTAIEQNAHGTLPNGPLPSKISDVSATVWELIAFNEIFEVAFFTELISNVTNNVPGYECISKSERRKVLKALTAIQAQEQLHALGANAILSNAGRTPVQACKYTFPVNNLNDAISFASTFTDVVVGTLQEALTNFGLDGDVEFINLIGGVIGQEGEQDGFFRNFNKKIPSALPFLTNSAGVFAFSALNQMVVVPNSCPNANIIGIPVLGALTVDTKNIGSQTKSIQFSFNSKDGNTNGLSLVYVNQQNVPVAEKLNNVRTNGGRVTFTADFPYAQNLMNGLTLAAVTNSTGPFSNATDVAVKSLYGPGLIEIN